MAGKRKKKTPRSPGRRLLRWLAKITAALTVGLLLVMTVQGNVVTVRFVDLPLSQLPPAFEGTRILYLTDLHINTLNSVDKLHALMDELEKLEPDLVLLGGDYTSFDVLMRLMGGGTQGAYAIETDMRDLFFLGLSEINAPLGKYGVAGEEDNLLVQKGNASLSEAMALGGVKLLQDQAVRLSKDGQTLTLVGVDDWRTGLQDTRTPASQVRSDECVILLCHNPEAIPVLNNQPGADGGHWIDAALCGHTHGGTIKLPGWELLSELGDDERYHAGWHLENGAKVLISSGISNSFLPLRLNASPEVHLITLKGVTR